MNLCDFLQRQREEALGEVNKWYCSQYYGYEVCDPERLLAYYIKHGGAHQFRQLHLFECDDINRCTPHFDSTLSIPDGTTITRPA